MLLGLQPAGEDVDQPRKLRQSDDAADRQISDAAAQALKMAGVTPGDVDVAELHDAFTILEIVES